MKVSVRLKDEIWRRRRAGVRQYKLAQAVELHPTLLSMMLNDMLRLAPNDARVIKLGKFLGLQPDECFDVDSVIH
jgi:plasmid maintenance system antidote protein VapI